jgi:hypothetical protein
MAGRVRDCVHPSHASKSAQLAALDELIVTPPPLQGRMWPGRQSSLASSAMDTYAIVSPGTPRSFSGQSNLSTKTLPSTPVTPLESGFERYAPIASYEGEDTSSSSVTTPARSTFSDSLPESSSVASAIDLNSFPTPPSTANHQFENAHQVQRNGHKVEALEKLRFARRGLSEEEKQARKERTDVIVKSYIRDNDKFVKKLRQLREKATGNQKFLDSIDEMMDKALMRRHRIAIEGERIHYNLDRHVENNGTERAYDEGLLNLAACVVVEKERREVGTKKVVSWAS